MAHSRLLTVLFALIVLAGFAPAASAHYDPGTGRWLERDPLGTTPGSSMRTIRVGDRPTSEPAVPRFGSGPIRPTRQYSDGMNLYQYGRSQPVTGLDPDGMKKYTYRELANMIGGCSYALPANSTDWRVRQRGLITDEVMLCLFWKESSFDTEARSNQGFYGLGQMDRDSCDAVDRAYKLPPGTCWRRQQSNVPCDQIANAIAYLHHVLTNPKEYKHDGTLRGGLREYGPGDAPFGEYADPILRCAQCLKDHERHHREDKGGPRGVEFCTPENAQSCFDKMNKEVDEARRKRLGRGPS